MLEHDFLKQTGFSDHTARSFSSESDTVSHEVINTMRVRLATQCLRAGAPQKSTAGTFAAMNTPKDSKISSFSLGLW